MRLERGGPIQTFYIGNKKMPVVEKGEGVYLYDEEGNRYLMPFRVLSPVI